MLSPPPDDASCRPLPLISPSLQRSNSLVNDEEGQEPTTGYTSLAPLLGRNTRRVCFASKTVEYPRPPVPRLLPGTVGSTKRLANASRPSLSMVFTPGTACQAADTASRRPTIRGGRMYAETCFSLGSKPPCPSSSRHTTGLATIFSVALLVEHWRDTTRGWPVNGHPNWRLDGLGWEARRPLYMDKVFPVLWRTSNPQSNLPPATTVAGGCRQPSYVPGAMGSCD